MSRELGPGPGTGPGPERADHERRVSVAIMLCALLVMFWMQSTVPPRPPDPSVGSGSGATPIGSGSGGSGAGSAGSGFAGSGSGSGGVGSIGTGSGSGATGSDVTSTLAALPAAGPPSLVLETDDISVETTQRGGVVRGIWLKKHGRYGHGELSGREDWLPILPGWGEGRTGAGMTLAPDGVALAGLLPAPDVADWTGEAVADGTLRWTLRYANGLTLVRTYSVEGRTLTCAVAIENRGDLAIESGWTLRPVNGLYRESENYDDVRVLLYPGNAEKSDYREPKKLELDDLVLATQKAASEPPGAKKYALDVQDDALDCAALAEKYFAIVVHTDQYPGRCTLFAEAVPAEAPPYVRANEPDRIKSYHYDQSIGVGVATVGPRRLEPRGAPSGSRIDFLHRIEVGPGEELERRPYEGELAHYGMFGGISHILLSALRLLSRLFGSYGWAIVALTFVVKLLMHPLTRRQQTSMHTFQEKMKKFQPELEALKKKYANNPDKVNKEMFELYRKHKIQPVPLGGCLPIFIQMPIFLGLFYGLSYSIQLRQQPFLWMADLAQPDRLHVFEGGWVLGFLFGRDFNLLPLIMTVVWVIQQRMTPLPADPTMAQQQKILRWMPIMFGYMLYRFASGLCLYWFVSNLIGIVEQKLIKVEIDRLKASAAPPS